MKLAIDYLGCKRLAEICRAGGASAGRMPSMDHIRIEIGGAEAFNRHVFLWVPVEYDGEFELEYGKYDAPGEWWVHGSALKLVKPRQSLVLDTTTRKLKVWRTKSSEIITEVPDKALTEAPGEGHPSTLWPSGSALLATARKGEGAVTFGLSGKVLRHVHKLLPTRSEEWQRIILHVRPDADGNAEGLIEVKTEDGCVAVLAPLILDHD